MREGLPDGGMAGVLLGDPLMDDPAWDDEVRGELVLRDGVLVRVVLENVVPPGAPFEDEPFDEAWFRDALPSWDTDGTAVPDSGQDRGMGRGTDDALVRPPAGVPVALWPQEVLRAALKGAPGVELARVIAEAIDLDGNLDDGAPTHGPTGDPGGDAVVVAADRLGELSDDVLGDLVVACGRLQSWSAGVQARAVAERAARESHPLAHNSLVGQVTGELVVTEAEAGEVVVRAESGAQHPTVIHALIVGRIDVRKAHTLLRSAAQLTVTERAEAITRFLPQAPRRTWKWLQNKMLAFAKDRHGAAETAKSEAQRRSVHVDRAENDMGWLSAYLPAPDAAAVWGVVDDMAHQLRHVTGEDRTLNQLRADSLTGIVTGRLLPADRFTDTGADADTETGEAVGNDDAGADGVRTDAGIGGCIGGESGGATETSGTTAPAESDTGIGDTGTENDVVDGTEEPVCTCGGRAPVQQVVVQEIVQMVRITPTRPVVRVTIPATALLGLDDAPGDLAGFGPIPAETARLIATDATWQRLLTDPVTGILTDYSTTTYKPGKVLRAAVKVRDETCTFLWDCDTPAGRCDLDHIEPFGHENKNGSKDGERGQTSARNLHALCRKHHLLKTHAGWDVVRDPDTGITTWTTPTGRTYTRPPTVLDTHVDLDQIDPDTSGDLTLQALTGQRLPRSYATTEPGTVPTDPDEPPF